MPPAVVLHKNDREVQVWLSKEHRIESIDLSDCPNDAQVGSPIELKIDARCRVQECKVLERPLKVVSQDGMTMFLDIFIFPQPNVAFSIFFGEIPVDSDFTPLQSHICYLVNVTWDKRRREMIILRQSAPKCISLDDQEAIQVLEAYEQLKAEQRSAAVRYEEPQRKEKLICAISPMERREEEMREEERSISDKMSSISSRMDSVSVREAKRVDDGRSSVRASNYSRPDLSSIKYADSLNQSKDVMQSRSEYSREGSTINSFTASNYRQDRDTWVKGIVIGEEEGHSKKLLVWTKKGMGSIQPRVYESPHLSPLKLGDYVDVIVRSHDGSGSYDVDDLDNSPSKPDGVECKIIKGKLLISCDIKYDRKIADNYGTWWLADNEVMGAIGVKSMDEQVNMKGKKATVNVTRLEPGMCIALEKAGVGWISTVDPPSTDKIDKKKEKKVFDGWYRGVVTAANDDCLFIACPSLDEDAVLYEKFDPEQVIGKWIKFQLHNLPGDPAERHRISLFEPIDPVYETRMKGSFPELRMCVSYEGAEDEGRAMFKCDMGLVRDCNAVIQVNNRDAPTHYMVWIIRYKKKNQISRWCFSRIDPQVVVAKESEIPIRSRSPSPVTQKHRATEERERRDERSRAMDTPRVPRIQYEEGELELREILKIVILEHEEIRRALIEADRTAFNQMFEILMDETN